MHDPVLDRINGILNGLELRSLPSRGDSAAGQPEIIDLTKATPFAGLFVDVLFTVRWTDGKTGPYLIRFNSHSATRNSAVMIVLIQPMEGALPVGEVQFAFVRQWRPPLGDYSVEAPRGFAAATDSTNEATALRELGEEVLGKLIGKGASVTQTVHLGSCPELSGTHAAPINIYLIVSQVQKDSLAVIAGTESGITTVLRSLSDIEADRRKAIDPRELNDCITLAALYLALPEATRLGLLG